MGTKIVEWISHLIDQPALFLYQTTSFFYKKCCPLFIWVLYIFKILNFSPKLPLNPVFYSIPKTYMLRLMYKNIIISHPLIIYTGGSMYRTLLFVNRMCIYFSMKKSFF